ncbi:Histone transcription regulator 3 [Recurvomyces mirabilis]|nr:Histone transcription regulator 3 [Recurvomyces mirabilis]
MSNWRALNIESDSESDDEIDDTKELQIEDALKLYQNALRLHAQGPAAFDQAAEAYRELFESEIFRYPESQNELQRIELYGPSTGFEDNSLLLNGQQGGVTLGGNAGLGASSSGLYETGPSTLPQILHLSHKNYAQFRLEHLGTRLDDFNVSLQQILTDATAALEHFVHALDKDDSDLDLWRKSAKVGDMLGSKRIARFCLEAVLEGDEEGLTSALALPGLEESLAGEQLANLVEALNDRLSVTLGGLSSGKRRTLSKALKQRLEVFRDVAEYENELLHTETIPGQGLPQPGRVLLKTPSNWAAIGELLLAQFMSEQYGASNCGPASAIGFMQGENLGTITGATFEAEDPIQMEPAAAVAESATTMHLMPTSIAGQFPGLDSGKPTTQPQIAPADPSMIVPSTANSVALPTRKRSGDAAGLQEGMDEGRSGRSKRTRLRESIVNTVEHRESLAGGDAGKQAQMDANLRWEHEQQLNEAQQADDWMFETVGNLFERIGVSNFDRARRVRQDISGSGHEGTNGEPREKDDPGDLQHARKDVRAFLDGYSEPLAQLLLVKGDIPMEHGLGNKMSGFDNAGLNAHEGQSTVQQLMAMLSEDGLQVFLSDVNNGWFTLQETAYDWLCRLLKPMPGPGASNTYAAYRWPTELKTMIVRTLVTFDETVYERACQDLNISIQQEPHNSVEAIVRSAGEVAEMLESIFELHLDIYTLIKEPNSGVDAETIASQGDRLQRWAGLAREAMHFRGLSQDTEGVSDELSLRFLWATTFHLFACSSEGSAEAARDGGSAHGDVTQDHVLECLKDLRRVLLDAEVDGNEVSIVLSNNAVMGELSVAVLERQMAKLTTQGFMNGLAVMQGGDAVAIIEGLEPLLLSLQRDVRGIFEDDTDMNDSPTVDAPAELVRFLQNSSLSVKLVLWNRLRDAYRSIDYQPMVLLCHFIIMRMLMQELISYSTTQQAQRERQTATLKTLQVLKDTTAKILHITQTCENALECIDENQLKGTIIMLGEVLQLIQVFNIAEDSVRVGQSAAPTLATGFAIPSWTHVTATMHEFQVNIWMVLYSLFREAILHHTDLYPTPTEDKFDFLRCVHRNLGLRNICGASNSVFVRMLKDEFVGMTNVEGYDSEQAQILYDLYGLNCFLNPSYELIEHHCNHDAFLDRGVAMLAVDLLLVQARKLPIKELVKHSLKDTIEKVHGVVPRRKPSEAIVRNKEIYRTFLRSGINPLDVFNALKGDGNELPILAIPKEDAVLASKGWYFLMGHLSLAKFKVQKRTTVTPTEELDIAIAFFHQDLEYSSQNWETWFRLAQAYDTKVEEAVVWSAEKLNSGVPEIVALQKSAIHCYTMATALVHRSGNLRFETADFMTELYFDFAARIYASSREPFGMLVFANEEDKFLSMPVGMGKGKAFTPLRLYTAWKLAKVLWERALEGREGKWLEWLTLGKCMWKMFSASPEVRGPGKRLAAQEVLAVFVRAIEMIPDKRDSREKKEPVLEPHYKLVSIVHKMIQRGDSSLQAAEEALRHTPYARQDPFPRSLQEWPGHMLAILKSLRNADKSNWHHRMIARAAHIVYQHPPEGGESGGLNGANAAKHEFTLQMFTKTMVLQVWRPESERAGRHFVYTARYTRFFTRILEQLADRPSLEALARRVRRRPHEIFEHGIVWQEICNAYLRLLRKHGDLSEGLETSTFSNIVHEDFLIRKEPLEKWMQAQDCGASKALDVLRDVQELKRINQGLMKPGGIDDLIGDAYAFLFASVGKQLWEDERKVKAEEDAAKAALATQAAASAPPAMARNPMMSLNALMNLDGATETKPTPSQPAPFFPPALPVLPSTEAPAAAQRKKIGVGRREIRTCAEACAQKAPAARATAAGTPRAHVVIENNRSAFAAGGDGHSGNGGDRSVAASVDGSLHDDADDESELSDLELEEVEDDGGVEVGTPKPMFPDLKQNSPTTSIGGGAEDGDEQGDDDVEMVETASPSHRLGLDAVKI